MSGERIVEMPALLFKTVSAKHHLIIDNKVTIPKGISENAVIYLVSRCWCYPQLPMSTSYSTS